jgi:glycosyltransferase involved in cell wall biosynthesis
MIGNKQMPKISIVTPTYNQGQYIEETIQSVLNQNYPNLEYIIIDGGSTDGTVELIKKYEKHLKYWVSEPDKGQANAINKGLKWCTGEIFNWLNSDDYLAPGALHAIGKAFEDPKVAAVAGQTIYFEDGNFQAPEQLANLEAKKLIRWDKGVVFIQPGLWTRRTHFIDCMGVDEQFHYAFDWDLIIRYLYLFPEVKYISEELVFFRLHDASKTVSSIEKFHKEEALILDKIGNTQEFKGLYKTAVGRNVRRAWYETLEIVKQDASKNKIQKMGSIIAQCTNWPSQKVNRITLGALKQIIFEK